MREGHRHDECDELDEHIEREEQDECEDARGVEDDDPRQLGRGTGTGTGTGRGRVRGRGSVRGRGRVGVGVLGVGLRSTKRTLSGASLGTRCAWPSWKMRKSAMGEERRAWLGWGLG